MTSYIDMLKEHSSKQAVRKELQEKRKSEAVVSAQGFTHAIVDHLNDKVARAYHNQKRLDVEAKKLQNNSESLQKVAAEWIESIDNFSYSLKVLGNVETFAKAIEKECTVIAKTLMESHKGNDDLN
ncbi:unnamed protein product [Bursaphelenchus okinawaensis]|uniref:Biogenesis of lysosome-related organelles complex 1 subunit 1 n=1 Tax=Bursaphelenchus okinawaensis TaxID=465554 RepID=A0A811K5L2_9BILA|nr:unnamed protein product [Bursaphelenchus okinawaensis]CAG9091804.1 unnamed protein product [Bursaphelenchus okinawaensis]